MAVSKWSKRPERTLNLVGGCLRVTIPATIVERLNLAEGDELTFCLDENRIVMEKVLRQTPTESYT